MSIPRITYSLPRFALFFLIFAAVIYSPRPAFGQTTDSSGEQAQEAHSVSGTSPNRRTKLPKVSNNHPHNTLSAA